MHRKQQGTAGVVAPPLPCGAKDGCFGLKEREMAEKRRRERFFAAS